MKISDNYFSHPNKNYNDHITRIAQSFDDENHKVVAHYHDLGKLSKAFQTYIALQKEPSESNEAFEKRRNKLKTTHTLESAYLYFCNEETRDNNFLANFFAILRHHSDLPNIVQMINDYLAVLDNFINDRVESIKDIATTANIDFNEDIYEFMDFFDELSDQSNYQNLNTFFLFKQRYSRLILADKFEAIFSKPYQNIEYFTQEKIDEHLQTLHSLITKKQEEYPNEYRTNARETIFKNFEQKDDSNIYLIKAPTGIGKTFIALELALKISQKKHPKRRIITAIPFTSIIDQTHQEYEGVLGSGQVLKYHHLTKYQQDDTDEKEQFSQKLFLADIWHEHFIVTTFNQLLYTLFSNHNRDNVRLETLRESVIIVDEVQNIPRVLLQNIAKVFEMFAKQYDIHFIIMSATMPYIYKAFDKATVLSEDWFYDTKQNRYQLRYKENIKDFETLADAINYHKKKSVLCVVNTIEKAKTLFQQINNNGNCYLLTTHQIPKHRKEIIEVIKCRLMHKESITLIATQLIEAGVDLDFDVGYREFAPFGSIIQMAGRVNREGKKPLADVFVFDFLELESTNEKLKKLPYHAIDLQEQSIKTWIEQPLHEIDILNNLDTYFKIIQAQSQTIELEKYMENLEFATLFQKLNENFMPNQPWKVSLFIEQKEGHFKEFLDKRQEFFYNAKDKFEALNQVKELEKDLGLYAISVNEKLLTHLGENISFLFGRYILPYGSSHYSKEEGFSSELTRIEEAFD
jgi:CRISPR-associated endonuclease/helicase Cas3